MNMLIMGVKDIVVKVVETAVVIVLAERLAEQIKKRV